MNLPIWKRVVAVALTALLICVVIASCTMVASGGQAIEDEEVVAEVQPLTISEPGVEVIPLSPEPSEQVEETQKVETPIEVTPEPTPEPEAPTYDRTKPIYEVYKGGYAVSVPADWQWYIRDMCETYDFPEPLIYGCILSESTFDASASSAGCHGLAQINSFWIHGANIKHFTDDYSSRNLCDPYDNILTLFEMWCYARDTYGIDVYSAQGQKDLLYWHNTGRFVRNVNWAYSERCLRYANELVTIQE